MDLHRPTASGSAIAACRHDDLVGRLRAAGLATVAGLGFVGLNGGGDDSSDPTVITGCKKPRGKKLPPAKKQAPADRRRTSRLRTLRVPVNYPAWSSNMSVLVKGSAEAVSAVDLQVADVSWRADRLGYRAERSGVLQRSV
ncbi:hypothetical protein ABZT42_54185, partial [Streptomyces mirabilis]